MARDVTLWLVQTPFGLGTWCNSRNDFTALGYTREELERSERAEAAVMARLDLRLEPTGLSWETCLERIERHHGKEERVLREAGTFEEAHSPAFCPQCGGALILFTGIGWTCPNGHVGLEDAEAPVWTWIWDKAPKWAKPAGEALGYPGYVLAANGPTAEARVRALDAARFGFGTPGVPLTHAQDGIPFDFALILTDS